MSGSLVVLLAALAELANAEALAHFANLPQLAE